MPVDGKMEQATSTFTEPSYHMKTPGVRYGMEARIYEYLQPAQRQLDTQVQTSSELKLQLNFVL